MRDDDTQSIQTRYNRRLYVESDFGKDTQAVHMLHTLVTAVWDNDLETSAEAYERFIGTMPNVAAKDSKDVLKELGIEIQEGREDDDDRYWETWEVRAVSKAASDKWGYGMIDWEFQDERDENQIADIVLRSLAQRGKPIIFTGYKS